MGFKAAFDISIDTTALNVYIDVAESDRFPGRLCFHTLLNYLLKKTMAITKGYF